jgi:uncharacterized membrane protein YphA (DoxX/SURF4 family)
MNTNKKTWGIGVLVIFIAFVFIQSLFFKFSGADETVHIFSTLDQWAVETFGISGLFLPPGPFNAYVIGTAELIASALLLTGLFTPRKELLGLGAILSLGVVTGAIFFHLFTPLGIEVHEDGGTLFFMACGIWLASAILIFLHKEHLCALVCKKKTP